MQPVGVRAANQGQLSHPISHSPCPARAFSLSSSDVCWAAKAPYSLVTIHQSSSCSVRPGWQLVLQKQATLALGHFMQGKATLGRAG